MDLRLHLMLRIAITALFCLAFVSVVVLLRSERELTSTSQSASESVGRLIELQLIERSVGLTRSGRFPNMDILLDEGRSAGQCIRYVTPDGELVENSCLGWEMGRVRVPAWFSMLFKLAFGDGREIVRPVYFRNIKYGDVIVAPDRQREVAQAWRDVGPMLGLTMMTVLALCTVVYFVIGRALRPTKEILAGLEQLERGDLAKRLPSFKLNELQRISAVFNQLAGSLQQSIAERARLTRKLINVQEEERGHLARDLHDEFGQCLAAMSAMTLVVTQTAEEKCPELVVQGEKISLVVDRMMGMLKSMLLRLRPPGIDELGLIESLRNLIAQWNSASGGRAQYDLQVRGDVARITETISVNVYRIVQECLTNASKHAHASKVSVTIDRGLSVGDTNECVDVIVEDNGATSGAAMSASPGMGLLGMKERVVALGGQLTIQSRLSTGLTVRAIIPLPGAAQAATA